MIETCKAQQTDVIFSEFHDAVFYRIIDTLAPLIGDVEGEEVAQEALLKVFLLIQKNNSFDNFRESLFAMKPLAFVIAKNMALSRIRHKKVREKFHEIERLKQANASIKSIESTVINDHQTQLMLEAVNHLPPICRQVFIHRKLYGKSHTDIAQMLSISTKTVENHLAKGLKLCRQYIVKQHIKASSMEKKRA
ncbi:RNA polymerase sigma factor [Glaciecola sp. SC05]|uniref:RNA polymerase sigma factor n=1 Tax=Glaciecola sp. SC05 TaxID=1987355 RepID=UPI0035276652